jgi:hypothetical protein
MAEGHEIFLSPAITPLNKQMDETPQLFHRAENQLKRPPSARG